MGVIEAYFRELPEPITTYALYADFMDAGDATLSTEARISQLQSVVQRLPTINMAILDKLLAMLHKVCLLSLSLSLSLWLAD
jgi:hypothetical protein